MSAKKRAKELEDKLEEAEESRDEWKNSWERLRKINMQHDLIETIRKCEKQQEHIDSLLSNLGECEEKRAELLSDIQELQERLLAQQQERPPHLSEEHFVKLRDDAVKRHAEMREWRARAEAAEEKLTPRPVDREELAKAISDATYRSLNLAPEPWEALSAGSKGCSLGQADAAIAYFDEREGQNVPVDVDELMNVHRQALCGLYQQNSLEETEHARKAIVAVAERLNLTVRDGKVWGIAKEPGCVSYPPNRPPRFNGGVRCDMLIGPCSCGAWHRAEDLVSREGDQ